MILKLDCGECQEEEQEESLGSSLSVWWSGARITQCDPLPHSQLN